VLVSGLLIAAINLWKWSDGLKVGNFQCRTEPIRLFIFYFFYANPPARGRIGGVATTKNSWITR
jgi:hypothetical protein